jgi:hypothetical protein
LGKLKAEIAGFALAVFLNFSFQLSTFRFSSVNTPRPRSLETRPRQTHLVGKAAPVAGGADPGRGAERLSEQFFGLKPRENGNARLVENF